MTANQTASPALFVVPGGAPRLPDPVKARVFAPNQVTHFETLQALAAPTIDPHRGLRLLRMTQKSSARRLHPGDVIYWAACLGGVCLLLLSATT